MLSVLGCDIKQSFAQFKSIHQRVISVPCSLYILSFLHFTFHEFCRRSSIASSSGKTFFYLKSIRQLTNKKNAYAYVVKATILKAISLSIFLSKHSQHQPDRIISCAWMIFFKVFFSRCETWNCRPQRIHNIFRKEFSTTDMLRKASTTPLGLVGKCLKPWNPVSPCTMYRVPCRP